MPAPIPKNGLLNNLKDLLIYSNEPSIDSIVLGTIPYLYFNGSRFIFSVKLYLVEEFVGYLHNLILGIIKPIILINIFTKILSYAGRILKAGVSNITPSYS